MKFKLIACDLDGTLLHDDSTVSAENFSAINTLVKSAVEFVVCTGRTFYEIPKELLECDDIRYIIYSDGSAAYDKKEKKQLFARYIDNDTSLKLLKLLRGYDTMVEFYENCHPVTEANKLNAKSYEYYKIDEDYRPVIDMTRIGVDDLEQYVTDNNRVEILNIFFRNAEEREACAKALQDGFDVDFTTSMDNNIEIMAKGVSKGSALKTLCEIIGIEKEYVIAAGDSKNDLTMFEFAGLSLSAGNASDLVKAHADAVVCSNNEHIVKYICDNITEV